MTTELMVIPPRGVSRTADPDLLMGDWSTHLGDLVDSGEMAATTATTYKRGASRFLSWLRTADTNRVGVAVVRSWRASLVKAGYKPATVATWFAGLRAFFSWAVAEGHLAYDPTAGVKASAKRRRQHQREPLSDAEVLRVLEQPDASTPYGRRDRALLHVLAYTGIRSVEAHRATVGDLRTNGTLKLFVHGKGEQDASEYVHIAHPDAVAAIYAWMTVHPRGGDLSAPLFCGIGNRNHGGALSLATIRDLVKRYYRAAGIRDPRKTTHSLRHSAVTNAIRHGAPMSKTMAMTRHRSIDTLQRYVHEMERDQDPAEGYVNYHGQ